MTAPVAVVMAGQVRLGGVVLALALGEVDQLKVVGGDVVVDVRGEPLGRRVHQRQGDEPVAPVMAEETGRRPTRTATAAGGAWSYPRAWARQPHRGHTRACLVG
jgi:hypothetical protein